MGRDLSVKVIRTDIKILNKLYNIDYQFCVTVIMVENFQFLYLDTAESQVQATLPSTTCDEGKSHHREKYYI